MNNTASDYLSNKITVTTSIAEILPYAQDRGCMVLMNNSEDTTIKFNIVNNQDAVFTIPPGNGIEFVHPPKNGIYAWVDAGTADLSYMVA